MDNPPSLRVLTSEKESVETWEFRVEALGLLFALLVLAGVIGEAYFPENSKPVHMASLLVSYGVAGEVVISAAILIIGRYSKRIQRKLDRETDGVSETRRIELQQHIIELKSQLGQANAALDEQRPRRLTNEQADAIARAVAPFKDTCVVVRYRMTGTDDAGFAQDFVYALRRGGVSCDKIETSMDMSDFENVTVCVSREDAIPNRFPEFVLALNCELANLGLIEDAKRCIIAADLKKGEFRLWIGASPIKRPSIPTNKNYVAKGKDESGQEIIGIANDPNAILFYVPPLPTDLSSIVPLPPPPQTPP